MRRDRVAGGRFDGAIAGIGTTSGTRFVIGMWDASPFGPIVDVMIERADGHRLLLAPSAEVGEFIATTYGFDEVRVGPVTLDRADGLTVTAPDLRLRLHPGRRTAIGFLLALVPRRIARATWWSRVIDPVARLLRPGVRTIGSAGQGRRERYCALDEHAIASAEAVFEGVGQGALREIDPPVRFGFGSTPRHPSLVRITTFVE